MGHYVPALFSIHPFLKPRNCLHPIGSRLGAGLQADDRIRCQSPRPPGSMSIGSEVLSASHIECRRKEFTLAVEALDLLAGTCVALLGRNGAGKSTLIGCLAGRIREASGSVAVRGVPLEEFGIERSAAVGVVPDVLEGLSWMTVRTHLALRGELIRGWDQGYVARLCEALSVPLDKPLKELSRGTQTKVAFISVEGSRPPVLLLDEPTTGLDPLVRRELRRVIVAALRADRSRMVLFSTHLTEDVQEIADRILVVSDGRITQDVVFEIGATVDERRQAIESCLQTMEGNLYELA
jgi:ABC-type multidrug transport system ATPase subunit